MIGKQIEKYSIISHLGEGGMASVYMANDNKFDTNVAVKVLNKEYVHNDNIRKRFLAEAKNMFKMSHPNIIKVTDLIEEHDTVAFVMEYIEGETLKEYLERKGKLSDDEIKTIFSQMLEAVGYVHEQNLVHRDIKPSNFMITSKGQIKLLDFGIAKNTDSQSTDYTQTGTLQNMGTPMYMSPEQIKSTKDVTLQSDIYSLGVVLWQMVMGKKPYDTNTTSTFELQMKIVQDDLPSTSKFWDSIIQKATAKDIGKRYNNCIELRQILDNSTNKRDNIEEVLTKLSNGNDRTAIEESFKIKAQKVKVYKRKSFLICSTLFFVGCILFVIFYNIMHPISQINTIKGLPEAIGQLEYSPDGKTIVAGSGEFSLEFDNDPPCLINLWDVDKGEIVKRLNYDNIVKGQLESLSFNKSGTRILIASSSCIKIESKSSSESSSYILKAVSNDFIQGAVFLNNEDQVLYIPDFGNKIMFWDAKSDERYDFLVTNFEQIDELFLSPDGKKLILIGHRRGQENGFYISTYNLESKEEIKSVKINFTQLIKFNKIGDKIALTQDNGSIEIRDSETLKVIKVLNGHYKTPLSLSFSNDDKYIASCSSDQMIKVFDLDSGEEKINLINEHKGDVNAISFNPESNILVTTGDDKTIKIWSVR